MAGDTDADGLAPTLQNILDQTSLKWIFVGGKGGVGKTTCSSCLAVLLAAVREKVLIISTDPAHNLSDAFRQKFTRTPTLVNGFTNLYAMEVDPTVETDDFDQMAGQLAQSTGLGGAGGPAGGLSGLLAGSGMGSVSELAGAIPGIDEAMSFGEMIKLVQTMDYSCIVFDTAPTGHTLRLLQFPSTLEKGLGKLMALKNKFGGMMDQVSRMMGVGEELGEDVVTSKLESMKSVVEKVNLQFKDPDMTTFVCVCIPEFLSLYETERLVQELARFEIDTHNIVINQVLFQQEAGESKLLAARVKMQQKYLDQFNELYEDFNITRLPLLEEEVRGVDALKSFGKHLITPYVPRPVPPVATRLVELEQEVKELRQKLEETQKELAKYKSS
ncbi:unnamed protein product [Closterium sp. Yama58-4]|nr:unnamed protein product [Closterium sp. Yama58-4]